jgi:predicted esterase
VFITHGTNDQILPIERCSRRIVPQLRERGLRVDYREFAGPHTVTPELASAAADWIGRG